MSCRTHRDSGGSLIVDYPPCTRDTLAHPNVDRSTLIFSLFHSYHPNRTIFGGHE